jgi:cytochrome P450
MCMVRYACQTSDQVAVTPLMNVCAGPIVRISPFEVHVKDPDWYDELYTNGSRKRDKSAWFVGRSGGNSVFGTIPHDHHRLRRSALNPFFSKRSIAAFEPVIQSTMNQLCLALEGYVADGNPVELRRGSSSNNCYISCVSFCKILSTC